MFVRILSQSQIEKDAAQTDYDNA